MFNELDKIKENLNLLYLHEINYDLLNNEEKILYNAAVDYEQSINDVIRLDLNKGIIVDELDNIIKIEKKDGEVIIIKDNKVVEKKDSNVKTYQKKLTPTPNSIYSN